MAEGNKVDAYEVIELQDANSADIDAEENQLQLMAKSAQKERVAQKDGRVVWRGANVMMVIFFVMAAGVQFNDPDPYLWVPLYGVAALLTACVAVRPFLTNVKVWQLGYWMHTIYCIGMFFYVFVELVIAATNPQSDGSLNPLTYEEGRELAGVMITTIWMFICKQSPAIRSKNAKKTKNESVFVLFIVIFSLLPLFLWALCYSDAMNSSYISLCSDFFPEEFSF